MSTNFVKICIVEFLTTGKSVVNCVYCNGKGKEPYPDGKLCDKYYADKHCSVCGPRGLLVLEHDDILIQCAFCSGTGHQPTGNVYKYNKKCPKCKGSGALSLTGKVRIISDPNSF